MTKYAALLQGYLGGKMQTDMKCLNCNKITRNVELGKVYYATEDAKNKIMVQDSLTCPKCKSDISQEKCAVKVNDFLMRLLAGNILLMIKEKGEPMPEHLRGMSPLDEYEYATVARHRRTKLKMVEKF